MRKILKIVLMAGILLSLGIANAQDAKEQALTPGKVIKLEIKFDGPDGVKITNLYVSLSTDTDRPADQAGFLTNFPGEAKLTSPGTFDVEFTIPATAVSGDYKLKSMDVRALGIQLNYLEGQQYHLHAFHIKNDNRFLQPPVTIKERP